MKDIRVVKRNAKPGSKGITDITDITGVTGITSTVCRNADQCDAGAVTVEAAVALPVFLCVIISILFIVKIIYVNAMIQHALTETADELASSAYIYHVSGLRDLHDTARDSINSRSDIFKSHIDTVFDAYNNISGLAGNLPDGKNPPGAISSDTEESRDKLGSVLDAAGEIPSNPLDELKNAASYIARGTFNDIKTQLFTPLTKSYMKKYLEAGSSLGADKRLATLGIREGMDGLDFNSSTYFEDENEDIELVVRYEMELPLPVKILPELVFEQRATARAWMGGDETRGVIDDGNGSSTEDDVWSLSNFERGRRIRAAFGGNLPDTFPVIARYEAGTAVMIKSMDLTAEGYQEGANVAKELDENIKRLAAYNGQDEPWGSSKITIRSEDIKSRELVLVIPENEIKPEVEKILRDYVEKASRMGIDLKIERYGTKRIPTSTDNTEGSKE